MQSVFPKENRHRKIDEHRRNKPVAELERKWLKAKGRHSNRFWCIEWLDLADHIAKKLIDRLKTQDLIE